jgi:hypothetical protein
MITLYRPSEPLKPFKDNLINFAVFNIPSVYSSQVTKRYVQIPGTTLSMKTKGEKAYREGKRD